MKTLGALLFDGGSWKDFKIPNQEILGLDSDIALCEFNQDLHAFVRIGHVFHWSKASFLSSGKPDGWMQYDNKLPSKISHLPLVGSLSACTFLKTGLVPEQNQQCCALIFLSQYETSQSANLHFWTYDSVTWKNRTSGKLPQWSADLDSPLGMAAYNGRL